MVAAARDGAAGLGYNFVSNLAIAPVF
jgi:hypothetical protein